MAWATMEISKKIEQGSTPEPVNDVDAEAPPTSLA